MVCLSKSISLRLGEIGVKYLRCVLLNGDAFLFAFQGHRFYIGLFMRKVFLALLFGTMIVTPCMAQDAPPTGIGYIPGMPVPTKAEPAPSAASSSAHSGNAGGASGRQDGKISRVSVANSQTKSANKAQAETRRQDAQPTQAAQPATPKPVVAQYHGVTPPSRLTPENEGTFTKTSANQLSWIGFMPEKSTHTVFLQTSKPTTYERLASSANRIEIRLSNTKLAVSNNKRELDMKYFQSPFARAYAKSEGKNVRVIVELKAPVEPKIEIKENIISISAPVKATPEKPAQ